jgi:hypothetical protein
VASRSPEDDAEPRLNLLIAYPYLTKQLLAQVKSELPRTRFLLDSGAFTAWKAGTKIELDDYCNFIEGLDFQPWRYFTLDVIGDPKATLKNYDAMLKRGFNPVPIFTRGDSLAALEHYYRTSDLVGVGGLVGTRGNKGFVNGIMKKIGKRRVHLLGFTRLDFLKTYRPYMCDTSSWEYGARMLLRLNAHVWAQKVQDEEVTLRAEFSASWPATWWQHLKQRWFPAWALRRWPVRMETKAESKVETHRFKCVALLPNFRYQAPPETGSEYVLKSWATRGASDRFPSR